MSKKNRLREYKRLVQNDMDGKKPGLKQDDGSLVAEFGKPKKEKK